MQVQVPTKIHRGPVLYARLKSENHAWMHQQARAAGYDSVSEYTDALIDTLRGGAPVSKTVKNQKVKSGTRKAK